MYESFQPLVVEELELDAPHEHEVLVKLTASGVCHSDLHYMKGDREHPLPVVLGHEGAGIVEEIGPGVTYAQPGDHVVLSFVPTCGHCSYCVKGRQNLCEARYQLQGKMLDGTTRLHNSAGDVHHFNGLSTFGEYAVVPEDSLVKIREDAPLDRVALIGCGVPTGVGAVINTAKVKPGSSVVVIGAGGVGLNVVQGAVLAGAEAIIAVDIFGDKLEHALQFGATHLVNAATEDLVEKVRDITRGEMADYAFEVIGSVDAINQAMATTKRGGTTVVVGVAPKGAELTIDPDFLHLDRVLMGCTYGSVYPRADMPMLVDLYMARRLKLDELITATFKLDQINTAFEALDQGEVARSIIRY
ncbi:MAG TPA: Zn-dependent alcohol dehydrogenase [Dehalococcoidia bacterium]|nr:Zn-dependent alcohol dehydrogenase [Dehalococcoidia bacterium]HIN25464.1 Zn-dependent alcohol dehydrogenase [Dehalococcoidia bacterium]